jgi:hypothetical protein
MDYYKLFKEEQIGINKITIEIESCFNNTYSILAYDDLNILWYEKFTSDLEQTEIIAEKLYLKAKKNLQNYN